VICALLSYEARDRQSIHPADVDELPAQQSPRRRRGAHHLALATREEERVKIREKIGR
jgi:hypothetical protein